MKMVCICTSQNLLKVYILKLWHIKYEIQKVLKMVKRLRVHLYENYLSIIESKRGKNIFSHSIQMVQMVYFIGFINSYSSDMLNIYDILNDSKNLSLQMAPL